MASRTCTVCVGDLGPDAVARDQRDVVRHWLASGSTACQRRRSSAASGVAPLPMARLRHSTLPVRASATTSESSARARPSALAAEAERGRHHHHPAAGHRHEACGARRGADRAHP